MRYLRSLRMIEMKVVTNLSDVLQCTSIENERKIRRWFVWKIYENRQLLWAD